jgi:uncharacterized protein (DUF1501 family)
VVVINLLGGLDGLAAFPYLSGALSNIINGELRPDLRIAPSSILPAQRQVGVANQIGFHPSFMPLFIHAKDNIKIVQNYGIPGDPGRSHDTCQTLMSLGATELRSGDNVGFLARLMDVQNWDSFQYWSFLAENPSDTNTTKKPPIVVNNLESLQLPKLWWDSAGDESLTQELQNSLLSVQIPRDALGVQQRDTLVSMRDTLATVKRSIINQPVGKNKAGDYSDNSIGGSLKDAARVLKSKKFSPDQSAQNKDTLILLGQGGYDTHSNQNSRDSSSSLAGNLDQLAKNLAVFWVDLELSGMLNDTVIVVYSEFGRTVYQNGTPGSETVGTDHGHGSSTMVLGGGIVGGVVGNAPTTSELRDEDYNALRPTTDFRDIFSDVFVWLGIDPRAIFNDSSYSRRSLGLFG